MSLADVQRVLALFAHGVAGRSLQLQAARTDADGPGARRVIGTDGDDLAGAGRDRRLRVAPPQPRRLPRRRAPPGRPARARHVRLRVEHELRPLARPGPAAVRVRQAWRTAASTSPCAARYPGAAGDLDRVLAHARSAAAVAGRRCRCGTRLVEVLVQHSLGAPTLEPLPGDTHRPAAAASCGWPARSTRDGATVARQRPRRRRHLRAVRRARRRRRRPADPIDLDEALNSSGQPTHRIPNESAAACSTSERDALGLPADDLDGAPASTLRGTLTAIDVPYAHRRRPGRHAARPGDRVGRARRGRRRRTRTATRPAAPSAVLAGRRSPFESDRSFLYDEWDYHRQGYLKGWCRLYEHRLRGDDHQFLAGVRRRHADLATQVRRSFSFVRPESWHRVHAPTRARSSTSTPSSTPMVDRRAGHVTDEHLYMRRERALREVATAFLLDMSGVHQRPGRATPTRPPPELRRRRGSPFSFGLRRRPAGRARAARARHRQGRAGADGRRAADPGRRVRHLRLLRRGPRRRRVLRGQGAARRAVDAGVGRRWPPWSRAATPAWARPSATPPPSSAP